MSAPLFVTIELRRADGTVVVRCHGQAGETVRWDSCGEPIILGDHVPLAALGGFEYRPSLSPVRPRNTGRGA
jgi:hypothetical protein